MTLASRAASAEEMTAPMVKVAMERPLTLNTAVDTMKAPTTPAIAEWPMTSANRDCLRW